MSSAGSTLQEQSLTLGGEWLMEGLGDVCIMFMQDNVPNSQPVTLLLIAFCLPSSLMLPCVGASVREEKKEQLNSLPTVSTMIRANA